MRTTNMLAAVALAAGLLVIPHVAKADTTRMSAVRDGIKDLDARTKVVKEHAAQSPPQLREECTKIVDQIEKKQKFVATRLDVYALLGKEPADEASVRAVEAPYEDAERLLATVEGWYRPRP